MIAGISRGAYFTGVLDLPCVAAPPVAAGALACVATDALVCVAADALACVAAGALSCVAADALACVAADASSALACGNSTTAMARGPLCSLRVLRYCAEALVADKNTQPATTAEMTRNIQVGYNFRRGERLMAEGKKAPDFSLSDENGSMVRLKELRGQNVVLFFYPKADTPG